MRIDATHRPWLAISAGILAAATLLYAFFYTPSALGSQGGTPLGLFFGVAGFAFMIFAALLGARKKVPVWRVGRAQTWMRGHLWLGLLALPLILFHAGFRFGGALTTVVMVLLIVVVASGVFGAALQHYLPAVMTREVPMETIYEQIDSVRAQLLAEADERIAAVCGSTRRQEEFAGGAADSGAAVALTTRADALADFYARHMRPFLEHPAARGHALADADQARGAFVELRALVPPELHEAVGDLDNLCEEERQLTRQAGLHHWLHVWLLLHVPLSLALLLLSAVHAILALRY
jgi:hypothetical protein